MNLPVILSLGAEREFDEAADWYQRHAGRGETFVDQVQKILNQIGQMPELHAAVYQDIRRVRVPQFPYNVYYRVLVDRIEVIAVFHHMRNPKTWQTRA